MPKMPRNFELRGRLVQWNQDEGQGFSKDFIEKWSTDLDMQYSWAGENGVQEEVFVRDYKKRLITGYRRDFPCREGALASGEISVEELIFSNIYKGTFYHGTEFPPFLP